MRGRPGGTGAGDPERRRSERGESKQEPRAEETRATSVRTGTLARTVGRGNPRVARLPDQTWSHVGHWLAPPQKGRNRGWRGDQPRRGSGEGPKSRAPHPVQDGWNSWSGSLGPPLAVKAAAAGLGRRNVSWGKELGPPECALQFSFLFFFFTHKPTLAFENQAEAQMECELDVNKFYVSCLMSL